MHTLKTAALTGAFAVVALGFLAVLAVLAIKRAVLGGCVLIDNDDHD